MTQKTTAATAGAGGVSKRFASEQELASHTGLSIRTLQSWRLRNQGPPFKKLCGAVRYDLEQFNAWVERCDGGGGIQ